MELKFIDENGGNPFPGKLTIARWNPNSYQSTEGFFHDDERIATATEKLAGLLGGVRGKNTLDVGYGANLAVSAGLRHLGATTFGLDSQISWQYNSEHAEEPPFFAAERDGLKTFGGSIEDLLHPDSQLNGLRFGMVVMWGSFDSGGYNFAIGGGEMGEFRVRKDYPDLHRRLEMSRSLDEPVHEELYRLMQGNKEKVLQNCASVLAPQGGILVVSSRYAYHGAGFSTDQLPAEKRFSLRNAEALSKIGASGIVLVGVSKESVNEQLDGTGFGPVSGLLSDDSALFSSKRAVYEAGYDKKFIRTITGWDVPLGRIDAVYARYDSQPPATGASGTGLVQRLINLFQR